MAIITLEISDELMPQIMQLGDSLSRGSANDFQNG
jgi:hypothetical protein